MPNRATPAAVLALVLAWTAPAVAQAPALEFGFPSIPLVHFDLEAVPAGPTDVDALRGAYPGSSLASVTIDADAAQATYDLDTDGNALAATDGGGSLGIVEPGDSYQRMSAVTVTFAEPTTEFGFRVTDWDGAVRATVYAGATMIGSIERPVGATGVVVLSNAGPYDRVEIEAVPTTAAPDPEWVVTDLFVAANTLDSVAGLSGPSAAIDFDALPTGPIDVPALQAAFQAADLAGVAIEASPLTTSVYDDRAFGKALAASDDAGSLAVIQPDDPYQNTDRIAIDLQTPKTAFGVGFGDWTWPTMDIAVYAGTELVAASRVDNPGSASVLFFGADAPFDRIEMELFVGASEQDPTWVLSYLALPSDERVAVPVTSNWMLLSLAALLMLLGIAAMRRPGAAGAD